MIEEIGTNLYTRCEEYFNTHTVELQNELKNNNWQESCSIKMDVDLKEIERFEIDIRNFFEKKNKRTDIRFNISQFNNQTNQIEFNVLFLVKEQHNQPHDLRIRLSDCETMNYTEFRDKYSRLIPLPEDMEEDYQLYARAIKHEQDCDSKYPYLVPEWARKKYSRENDV